MKHQKHNELEEKKRDMDWADEGVIELKPAPGRCCPDMNKRIVCSGCDKDYGDFYEAIRDAEEKIKTKAMRACRDEYHNYTLDGQQIEEKISEL